MTEIPKTKIATSDPLTICNGVPLFPKVGTIRAGYVGTGMGSTLVDIDSQTALLWRFSLNAGYEVVFGICGPAYAVEMEVEGSTDNGIMELNIEKDEIQVGILFGVTITFVCNFRVDCKHLHLFQDPTWKKLLNVNINIEFDAIELLYDCLKEVYGNDDIPLQKSAKISNALVGSWGIYDEHKDHWASNGGRLEAAPTLNIPIDLTPYLSQTVALNELLKSVWGKLSFGPSFGVVIPVTIDIATVNLDETKYDYPSGIVDKSTGMDPVDPSKITVELRHTPGFDLTFGIFLNLNMFKFLNLGFTVSEPILKLLGIEPHWGPYTTDLSNTLGQTTVDTCSECGGESATIFDVIFEPPGGQAV